MKKSTTNNEIKKSWSYKTYFRNAEQPDGPWYYEQLELGFNFRLNDIMGSIGITQLKKIDKFISEREKIARHYDKLFKGLDIIIPKQPTFRII